MFIVNDLNNRLYTIDNRIKVLESKNNISEISINKFLTMKFFMFLDENFNYIIILVMLLLSAIIYNLI